MGGLCCQPAGPTNKISSNSLSTNDQTGNHIDNNSQIDIIDSAQNGKNTKLHHYNQRKKKKPPLLPDHASGSTADEVAPLTTPVTDNINILPQSSPPPTISTTDDIDSDNANEDNNNTGNSKKNGKTSTPISTKKGEMIMNESPPESLKDDNILDIDNDDDPNNLKNDTNNMKELQQLSQELRILNNYSTDSDAIAQKLQDDPSTPKENGRGSNIITAKSVGLSQNLKNTKQSSSLMRIQIQSPDNRKKAFKNRIVVNAFGGGGGVGFGGGGKDIGNLNTIHAMQSFGKEMNDDIAELIDVSAKSKTKTTTFAVQNSQGRLSAGLGGVPSFDMKRSNTLTLDSFGKDALNKRRQSSLLVRRNQTIRNLPMRIDKIWKIFANYKIEKLKSEQKDKEDADRDNEEQFKNDMKKDEMIEIQITKPPEEQTTQNDSKNSSNSDDKKENNNIDDSSNNMSDPEQTPEPESILDKIINSDAYNSDNKRKKNGGGGSSTDKIGIDPSIFSSDDHDGIDNDDSDHDHNMQKLAIDPRLLDAASGVSSNASSVFNSDNENRSSDSKDNGNESDSDDELNPYSMIITYDQYNIVLNNCSIETSPDMSAALIWTMLLCNNMVSSEIMNDGLEEQNLHNDPMKERSYSKKQFKMIMKCRITYAMFSTMISKLGQSVSRQDKSMHPKHLSYHTRNLVIWDKITDHLFNKTGFNVEEDYLFGTLGSEELGNAESIISMLSSFSSHWMHRVQVMEYIDDKVSSGNDEERADFFNNILSENDNWQMILSSWAVQLTDDRSGVARTAVTLLPPVIAGILLSLPFPAVIFDEEAIIKPMYNGIFTLVKNRRLKDMADDAYESLIQITDLFAQVAGDLEDYELLKIVVTILEDHTNPKKERHDKAREACVGSMGFLLYGVENPDDLVGNQHVQTGSGPNLDVRDLNTEMKKKTSIGDVGNLLNEKDAKASTNLSKVMQRAYLLENEEFVISFGNVLKHGVSDKSETARKKTFKLIQRLEKDPIKNFFSEFADKWDYIVTKKYGSWKRQNEKKQNKRKNSKMKGKNKGRKNSKRPKNKNKKKSKLNDNSKELSPSPSPSPSPNPIDNNSDAKDSYVD